MRWRIFSIPVNQCERLPNLNEPEGYVCLLEDSRTGNYYINNSYHPDLITNKWNTKWRDGAPDRYRLVRIYKVDNAVEFKKFLYQRHKDNRKQPYLGWFKLDSVQLRKLDGFISQYSKQIVADRVQLKRWNLRYFAGISYRDLPKLKLPAGYVYVARDLYTGNYKIGYTNDPVGRIKYLEEKAPGEIEYAHILQSNHVKETETFLHEQFKLTRIGQSEWFRLNDAELKEIQSLTSKWQHKRQAPLYGSSSSLQSDRLSQTPAIPVTDLHQAPQVNRKVRSPELHRIETRRTSRKWSRIGIVASIVVIFVATYIAMLNLVNVPESAERIESLPHEADTPTNPSATSTTLPTNRAQEWAGCEFVYSCPSFDCKPVGLLASIDELLFLQCVAGQTSDAEWIQLIYKNDKAYLRDRECSSRNYSIAMSDYTVPQEPAFTCDCFKKCDEITSCAEAFFQLNDCGCSYRDYNEDGIPCESLCRCD